MAKRLSIPVIDNWKSASIGIKRWHEEQLKFEAADRIRQDHIARTEERFRLAVTDSVKIQNEIEKNLRHFCEEHKDEIDDGTTREKLLAHGRVWFKKGRVSLALLAGWDKKRVLVKLKELKKRAYIRVKHEVNLQKLNTDYNAGKISKESLKKIGLKPKQKDEFHFAPHAEAAEKRAA